MIDQLWSSDGDAQGVLKLLEKIASGQRIPFAFSNKQTRLLALKHGAIRSHDDVCAIRNPIYEYVLQKQFEIQRHTQSAPESKPRAFEDYFKDAVSAVFSGTAGPESKPRAFEDYFKKLKNFDGWVTLSVTDDAGAPLPRISLAKVPGDRGTTPGLRVVGADPENQEVAYSLRANSFYYLVVVISKKVQPHPSTGKSEQLRIADGEDPRDAVEFTVRPESFYALGLQEGQTRCFTPHLDECIETFRFPLKTHTTTTDSVQLYINIYQGISLVHISRLSIVVTEEGA